MTPLLLMFACSDPPPQLPDPAPEPNSPAQADLELAVADAHERIATSGWDAAIGPFGVHRMDGAPRGGDRLQQILADATLAWFDVGDRALVVTQAAFTGPVWHGDEDPEASELVSQCPGKMLRSTALLDLVLHELGHGAQLADDLAQRMSSLVSWGALGGWEEAVDRERGEPWNHPAWEPADGYHGMSLRHEWPEVAVRLCRGEGRGDGAYRLAQDDGLVSPYAYFDPLEDFAESFALYHRDPVALSREAPLRYLALATPSAFGGKPVPVELEADAVKSAFPTLMERAPEVAMEALRVNGDRIAPHIQALATEPFAFPPDTPGAFDLQPWHVMVDGKTFRPADAWFAQRAATIERRRQELEEFEKGLEALKEWAEEEPNPAPEPP